MVFISEVIYDLLLIWTINWPGNVLGIWERECLKDDGHQVHAFVLGLWNPPHLVRLVSGRPGNCLIGESYSGGTWLWDIFFSF